MRYIVESKIATAFLLQLLPARPDKSESNLVPYIEGFGNST